MAIIGRELRAVFDVVSNTRKADLRKRELFVMVALAQGGWLVKRGESRMLLGDGFVKMAEFQFLHCTTSQLIRSAKVRYSGSLLSLFTKCEGV